MAWCLAWYNCSCRWYRPLQIGTPDCKICAMVAKARRNMPSMDLVVFPEYALHGLSWTPIQAHVPAGWSGSHSLPACLSGAPHLGLLLAHGVQSARQPLQQRHHYRRPGELCSSTTVNSIPGCRWNPGSRRPGHPGVRWPQRCEDRPDHLSRRDVSRDGARGGL